MKKEFIGEVSAIVATLALLLLPAIVQAQTEQAKPSPPPIAQNLVREGDFAVKLQSALGLGTGADEVEAENRLGDAGISPRNGWIADYPVTPDIMGELQKSVSEAAEAGKIEMGTDEALKRLNDVATGASLSVSPYTGTKTHEAPPEEVEKYPNPSEINSYYYSEGPPVVTYYAPPPDFYYLYNWVPYPFWWYGFWFPGFFILHDFHRTVFVGHRVCFVSNHFNDFRAHRVFRIDPVERFHGKTFAGIGMANRRGFIATGVPHSERRIFNGPRTWGGPGGRTLTRPGPGGRALGAPSRGGRTSAPSGARRMTAPSGGARMTAPSGAGRAIVPRSGGVKR
jgi:hypothetical protein